MQSTKRILLTALVITVVWCAKNGRASSVSKNLTKAALEDDDQEPFTESEILALKERYRRLIPHMTYYVVNNYINPKSYRNRIAPPMQRRFQYSGSRISGSLTNNNGNNNKNLNNNNKNFNNNYYANPPINREKFIPSFQYDPKDMDNEDYFTPVRYNANLNFDDYRTTVDQRYRTPQSVLTQATTVAPKNLHVEQVSHFTTIRPSTTINFTPGYGGGDVSLRSENFEPVDAGKDEIVLRRPNSENFYNFDQIEESYSNEEFEPVGLAGPQLPQGFRLPETQDVNYRQRKPNVNLNHIVKSLQLTNQLPEMLNADNIDDSIKTLVEILNILNNGRRYEDALVRQSNLSPNYENFRDYEVPKIAPKIKTKKPVQVNYRPAVVIQNDYQTPDSQSLNNGPYHVDILDVGSREYLNPDIQSIEQSAEERPEIVQATTPINYDIDNKIKNDKYLEASRLKISTTTEGPALNYPAPDGVLSHTQNFPPTSVKYGATRGKPNVDYPAYAAIPKTQFSCTTQRYKGFFGDPDTGCQVWHYCDLNGGKASFLCPNGTIFSQVALTCDWWFNVKCESTTQLYVLNERLYKYILPVMPKFPEDFTGPEVDRYLELKFKEMETKLKEKKLKKHQEELNKSKTSTPKTETKTDD